MTRYTLRKQLVQAIGVLIVASASGMGCQPAQDNTLTEPSYLTGTETDALMLGSWEIERANVTFFDDVTGDILAGPVDVSANEAVPVQFNPEDGADLTMLVFGGSFHFGEGLARWSRLYLDIIEDGEYVRNAEEEYEAHPPPWNDPNAGAGRGTEWGVDEGLRLLILADDQRIEAMVDMDTDGEHVWLDYDRDAPLFNASSCINSVHLKRIASDN